MGASSPGSGSVTVLSLASDLTDSERLDFSVARDTLSSEVPPSSSSGVVYERGLVFAGSGIK